MNVRRLFGRETLWLGFWLVAGAAAVVAYNTWSLCCGACSVENLLTLGWPGWILLSANLAALMFLGILKRVNSLKFQVENCECGQQLWRVWQHCPRCGKEQQ